MTRARRARIATAALVAAVLMVRAPVLAWGAFVSRTAAEAATFSTLQISPPTGVTATPGCAGTLKPKITLTWTASTTSRVTGYGIERGLTSTVTTEVGTVGASTATYSDTSTLLVVNTKYFYVIRAYVGTWYAGSSVVSATTPTVC